MSERAARRLRKRAPLPVDPRRSIAIKRDVHELVVGASAADFAQAFRAVLQDPDSRFGLIRVRRPAERVGQRFVVGERFQGCFSLRAAARKRLGRAAALLELGGPIVDWIEDQMMSNYAEVMEIVEDGGFAFEYRYLEGTPIAGRSVFTVEPIDAGRCRVRQTFEYQEVNGFALATFQRFGLKLHDQVVQQEVEQAAARAGARVLSGTIPAAYGAM